MVTQICTQAERGQMRAKIAPKGIPRGPIWAKMWEEAFPRTLQKGTKSGLKVTFLGRCREGQFEAHFGQGSAAVAGPLY